MPVGSYEVDCAFGLTTPPTIEPLSVEDAKAQIRSVQDQEDGLIESYIRAARQAAENYLGRGLLTQSWTLALSDFAPTIPLPMAAPLQTVTSVKYYDTNGTQQTLASTYYTVDTRSRPGRIALAANQTWPAVQYGRRVNCVEIEYVVGWTAPDLIDGDILQGLRLYIGHLESNRDGLDPAGANAITVAKLFWNDRVFWVPPCKDTY